MICSQCKRRYMTFEDFMFNVVIAMTIESAQLAITEHEANPTLKSRFDLPRWKAVLKQLT